MKKAIASMALMGMLLGYACSGSKKEQPNKFVDLEQLANQPSKSMIGNFLQSERLKIPYKYNEGSNTRYRDLLVDVITVRSVDGKLYTFVSGPINLYNAMNLIHKQFPQGKASYEELVDLLHDEKSQAEADGIVEAYGIATEVTKPPLGSGVFDRAEEVGSGFVFQAIMDQVFDYAAKNNQRAKLEAALETCATYIEEQIKRNKITDYNKLAHITFLTERAKEYKQDMNSVLVDLYLLAEKNSVAPEVRKRMLDDVLVLTEKVQEKQRPLTMKKVGESYVNFVRDYIDNIDRGELYNMLQIAKGLYINSGMDKQGAEFASLTQLEKRLVQK